MDTRACCSLGPAPVRNSCTAALVCVRVAASISGSTKYRYLGTWCNVGGKRPGVVGWWGGVGGGGGGGGKRGRVI